MLVGAHPWVYAATQPDYEITPILAQIFGDAVPQTYRPATASGYRQSALIVSSWEYPMGQSGLSVLAR